MDGRENQEGEREEMKTVNTKTNPNQTRVFDVVDNQLVTRWVDPKPAKQPNPRPLYNLLQALVGPQAILYAGEKKVLVDAWNSGAIRSEEHTSELQSLT